MTSMTLRDVFDHRARALASPADVAAPVDVLDVLICRVGDNRYAIRLQDLVEVTEHQRPTPLPGFAPVLAGMVNIRGRLLLAMDLPFLVGAGPAPARETGFFLVLRVDGLAVGFAADGAEEMRRVDRSALIAETTDRAGDTSHIVPSKTADRVSIIDVQALVQRFSAAFGANRGAGK